MSVLTNLTTNSSNIVLYHLVSIEYSLRTMYLNEQKKEGGDCYIGKLTPEHIEKHDKKTNYFITWGHFQNLPEG